MTREEYQKYLDDQKSKLTDKDKLSLQREYNKLKSKLPYWCKRMCSVIVVSESDWFKLKYAEAKYDEISSRLDDLRYLLDIQEPLY
jgi:hypothetical protein